MIRIITLIVMLAGVTTLQGCLAGLVVAGAAIGTVGTTMSVRQHVIDQEEHAKEQTKVDNEKLRLEGRLQALEANPQSKPHPQYDPEFQSLVEQEKARRAQFKPKT